MHTAHTACKGGNDSSAADSAAHKSHVDTQCAAAQAAAANGISWKASARAKCLSNITGSYSSFAITAGSNGALSAQDGITCAAGDRLLLAAQSDKTQNGVYVITALGDASNPYVLTRSDDMKTDAQLPQAAVFVQQGTTSADKAYVVTNDGALTIDSSNIDFSVFASTGEFSAGNGIAFNGKQINCDVDDSTIEIASAKVALKAGGVSASFLASNSVTSAKIAAGAVAAAALASASVATASIQDDAVTAAKIADNAIQQAQLSDDCVGAAELASNACVAASYSAGSVGTVAMADASVTSAKLASLTTLSISGQMSAGSYVATSDRRMKARIAELNDAACMKQCAALQPVSFVMKNNPNDPRTGLIAQECLKVAPELVKIKEDGSYGVNYVDFTAHLLASVRDLNNRLLSLENMVA